MTATKTDAEPDGGFQFESSLRRLEEIAGRLEQTDSTLDQALQQYEEGVRIARELIEQLRRAELRIRELRIEDDDSDMDQ